ncbi:MAG: site-specific DNA-methyltransferase [bacterium]
MPTLDFKGKSFVYAHHLSVPFRELIVDAKKSLPLKGDKPSLDDNLIIHGDNLHALKALMPVYAGKVDCIFIDPPYNTGNEGWCYNDNVRSPLMREWLKKSANPVEKEDLERHDKWLCMMWPRVCLLRDLLADDGVIFITLDDNEQHQMRSMMDEIFVREESFYAQIAWQKKYATANDALGFSPMFDHILVYRKSAQFSRNLMERTEGNDANYRLEDERGVFRSGDYTCNKTAAERPNLYYPITHPLTGEEIWPKKTAVWRYSKERHAFNVENGFVWWGKDGKGKVPSYKRYKHLLKGGGGTVPSTWWPHEFAGHTDEAKKELRDILSDLPEVLQSITPKPVRLLQRILEIATDENSLVLDSFAGSGTTAQAVLALNKKDGGNRKFILVETENYADKLTAERVRRVIQGYKFNGTQREELWREPLNFTSLKNSGKLLEKADSFELLDGKRFDRIAKTVENGALVVTGEKKITEKVEGLGGSFTYATLGPEMTLDKLLSGGLPAFESLAKYVFFTATGRTLSDVPKQKANMLGFIGETDVYRVHLHYQPDKNWLQSNDAALTEKLVDELVAANKDKKKLLVFAAAKFMSQRELSRQGLDFCQLPYAIHRILGD